MRLDRGVTWDRKRLILVRQLLKQGYPREVIATRLGTSRVALRSAINRFGLDPKTSEAA